MSRKKSKFRTRNISHRKWKSSRKRNRPPKSRQEVGKKRKKDPFSDALNEDRFVDENEKIYFIKSSFHLSFVDHFLQKFYDSDIWKVLIGSFCCALFVGYNWHIIAIISFLILLGSYSQWKSSEKSNAIEYSSKMLSKDPDRLKQFLALTSAPKNLSSGKVGDSPCEWVNDILAKFWPHINTIAQTQIDKKGFSKEGLDVGNGLKIYFERFTLGDKPPSLTSIHVQQTKHRKDEITLIVKMVYFGNCLVLFSYKTKVFLKAKAGVKDIYFRGNAVVVLRPLLEVPPFIGGISVCLDDIPIIDYNGLNLANIADNKLFKNFVINTLKDFFVTPNKIYVPLLNNANVKRELKFPIPIGLSLIEIIEAEDLPAMDPNRCLVLPGSSDSFCKLKIGDNQFTTAIIYSNLNPYFGEIFSAPIHDFNDFLKIEVLDKDALSADDLMGSIEFKLSDIGRNNNLNGKDKWLPIGKCLTGSLHFRIAVFELSSNKKNVEKIELALKESSVKFPVGIFSVYVYFVSHISTIDEEFDFKPIVKLKFSDQVFQTKTSKPPKRGYYYFEESSHFLVNDLKTEFLEVSVVCQEMNTQSFSKVFGECNIAVKDIIYSKDMTLNQNFPIKKILRLKNITEVKNTGIIRMFLSLRVCKFRKTLVENLKIAPNIQANIEQTTENKNSITKLYREPITSLKNPLRSMKIIGNRVSPFAPKSKTVVAEDITKIPRSLDEGCWLKVRIKWPDRTSLHIEVLKLLRIPLEIVEQSFKYAVCVKLSVKQIKTKDNTFTQNVIKRIGFKGSTGFDKEKIRRLQKRYTNKYSIVNYVNDIYFYERLIFKISSANNIDNHVLEFFLVLYQPRKYFAVIYDSTLAAASVPIDIPRVEFKGDPIEHWCRINLYNKFKKTKT